MPLGFPIPMFQKCTCWIWHAKVSAASADENNTWQEIVYYIPRSKTGVTACHTESWGQTRWWQKLEDRGQGGELGPQPSWSFQGKGKTGQNKQFRIGQFEQFQHAWAIRVVFSCLVSVPRMIWCKENIGLMCEKVLGIINSGLVDLDMKSMLTGKLLLSLEIS